MSRVQLQERLGQRRLIIGSFFTDLNESEYQDLCIIFAGETLLKESREQLQQKEDEISILADLVKGRDLTIKQKDERIKYFEGVCDGMNKELADKDEQLVNYQKRCVEYADTLTSYREIMGRMEQRFTESNNLLINVQNDGISTEWFEFVDGQIENNKQILTDYKNLEG